jgi:2-oxoglutarate dehydrogenase E1 component
MGPPLFMSNRCMICGNKTQKGNTFSGYMFLFLPCLPICSVHSSWNAYFSNVEAGKSSEESFVPPPSFAGSSASIMASGGSALATSGSASGAVQSDSLGVAHLIRAYQVRGHEAATLDPLGIHKWRSPTPPPELDYRHHGFKDEDLDRTLNLLGTSTGGNTGFLHLIGSRPTGITLRQIIETLKKTYCSSLGVEYMHIGSQEKCNWVRSAAENPRWMQFSKEKKLHIYERLCFADHFEKFLANKFNTAKRFGLEGGDSCIPGLKAMVDRGSELGIESFIIGMPHRGRLNVLANVMRKPMPQIFREFQGTHYDLEQYLKNDWSSAGDVKYHLGTSMDRSYPDGRRIHMSLVANPSHLEAVNPVSIGKCRAKQYLGGNKAEDKLKHMPILLHGDAAFAGQGIVYETFQMSRVPDFAVGGTIHVIVNNQVGFTTDPSNGRSTHYASDLAKAFSIPIFHCNGDDPLAVVTAFEMAVEWRQKFGEDCVVDLICYRKYGHNELDQPMYTQPNMYSMINKHPDTLSMYAKQLVEGGNVTQDELDKINKMVNTTLENDFVAAKAWQTPPFDWLSSKWGGFLSPVQRSRIRETGYDVEKLREIGLKSCEVPANFKLHKQLEKIIATRRETIEKGAGIDWGTAESLAVGTLLVEGNHVRLTGQDVERGTFSHRHAVLVDQVTTEKFIPVNKLNKHASATIATSKNRPPDMQGEFTVRNSILSEFGVLGFEMGYSLENPNMLVMWEAQFGDFVNGAQVRGD